MLLIKIMFKLIFFMTMHSTLLFYNFDICLQSIHVNVLIKNKIAKNIMIEIVEASKIEIYRMFE